MTLFLVTVLAASLIGAVTDVRTRRIPNWLVLALLIAGLVEHAVLSGWTGVLGDLALAGAVMLAGTVAFSFKLIGGGDVKLLAAAAGTLGYPAGITFVLLTLVCGGVLALVFAAFHGRLQQTFSNVRAAALPIFAGARPARPQTGLAMPYALAIFAGALCATAVSTTHTGLLP